MAQAIRKDEAVVPLAIIVNGQCVGKFSFLNIVPSHGRVEVGNVLYSKLLQRTAAASEAQFLLMQLVFDVLGYRRYEWKCDSRNMPSREAALRLGFSYEGLFRQHMVVKGENRDTAWFSIIDTDWPRVKSAFVDWLVAELTQLQESNCTN